MNGNYPLIKGFLSRAFCLVLFMFFIILLPHLLFAQELTIPPFWLQAGDIQSGDIFEESRGRGLSIRSNPQDARVFIDGIERGTTPLMLENISPGEYSVRLVKDGYKERRFSVMLIAGTYLELTLVLEEARGHVLLQLQADPGFQYFPLNPVLSIDGRESNILSSSTLSTSLVLPIGWRSIRVRAFGWEEETFDIFIEEDSVQNIVVNMRPAFFRISNVSLNRRRFNPANAGSLGTTELSFNVSGPGQGSLVIQNSSGIIVFENVFDNFDSWAQSVQWNGRNSFGEVLPDGPYLLTLNLRSNPWDDSPPITENYVLEAHIDSANIIQPLNISSGKSGLLYVPFPDILPSQALQIDASLLFGHPPLSGEPWRSLPFSGAFRFSLFELLELSAALNALPLIDQGLRLGIAGTAKWTIFNPSESGKQLGNMPLGLALGASISWVDGMSLTPFGMGSGIEIFLPVSIEVNNFSFHLAPAFLLTSREGFLSNAESHLIASAGIKMNWNIFSAGLSMRTEFNLSAINSSDDSFKPSLMSGLEFKYFPLPSNLVFTAMTGIWLRDSATGIFGGIGLGMIY